MNKTIPTYFYEKANVNRLILFTAIFNLLFINIYEPFGSLVIYRTISEFKYFFLSSVIILDGMLVVVLSRLVMFAILKRHAVTYVQYACWVLCEIVAMTLFFSLFAYLNPEREREGNFGEIFNEFVLYTCMVLLIPYSIYWLYCSWSGKHQKKDNSEMQQQDVIQLADKDGDVRIAVQPENVVYVESFKKYVTIHYMNQSRLSHFLIRNTIKNIDEKLTTDKALVRCHCHYIVNVEKVKVLHKDHGMITMELDDPNQSRIPVSGTFYENVISKLSECPA